jgi:hypothetical protein
VSSKDIGVREALRLNVDRANGTTATLFFVHGHQGTRDSDRWRWLSRLFVRHIWRPLQRRTGYSATTPARNYLLRAKHDQAMLAWAQTHTPALVLIASHTHLPVFARSVPDPPTTRPIAELEKALRRAIHTRDTELAAALGAELEYARAGRAPDPRRP